jgi:DNA-binding CsgD family transcriptional regulator
MTAAESAPHAPFIVDAMLLTESQMDRHAVYDWYTKHDVRYTIGSGLIDTDRLHVNWSLERSNGQGHADRTDVDLFLLIKPHLAQAVSLALQVGSLTGLTPATMAILDCIPHAAFALDRAARVIAVSRRAELLLVRGDGLSVVKGRLAATAANDNSALLRAIVTAQRGIGGWLRVRRSSGSAPYLLSVLPLGGESEHPLAPQASVLIFVQDPSERRGVSCDLLMAMFGFTPAEARLASALSFGHSLESAAQLLHLSVQTERSYLKAIFRKTAVNRQQDLVRLLASLPFPNGAGAVSH